MRNKAVLAKFVRKGFLVFVCGLLLFTSVMKLVNFFTRDPTLMAYDPVVSFLRKGELYFIVACLEIGVVGYSASKTPFRNKCLVIFGLSVCFAIYRSGIYMMHKSNCSCAGLWAQNNTLIQRALFGSLCLLLVGSAIGLFIPGFIDSASNGGKEQEQIRND